jgi:hypothetical protein
MEKSSGPAEKDSRENERGQGRGIVSVLFNQKSVGLLKFTVIKIKKIYAGVSPTRRL